MRKARNTRRIGRHAAFVFSVLLTITFGSLRAADKEQGREGQDPLIQAYKEHAEKVEEMFQWLLAGAFGFYTVLAGTQWFSSRTAAKELQRATARFDNRIEEIRSEIDDKVKKANDNFTEITARKEHELSLSMDKMHSCLLATIDLYRAKLELTREISDLQEPSIHHVLSPGQVESIKEFLGRVKLRKQAVESAYKALSGTAPPEVFDELTTLGQACHYIRDYKPAIEWFGKALVEIEKEQAHLQGDEAQVLGRDRNLTLLRIGNSLAGLRDYPRAIDEYCRMTDVSPDLQSPMHLSKGHAYDPMKQYVNAASEFTQVKEMTRRAKAHQGADRQKLLFWQATYELANVHTTLGQYENAAKDVQELLDNMDDVSLAVDPIRAYLSCGFFLWRRSNGTDWREAAGKYDEAGRLANESQSNLIGEVLYRKGRLHLSEPNFLEAAKTFQQIEAFRYSVDNKSAFEVFYGYALWKGGGTEEIRRTGKSMIDTAVLRLEEERARADAESSHKGQQYLYLTYSPSYELAMGLAMKPEESSRKTAVELLRKLTTSPYDLTCVKAWATAADCSDFPELKNDPEFRKAVDLEPVHSSERSQRAA